MKLQYSLGLIALVASLLLVSTAIVVNAEELGGMGSHILKANQVNPYLKFKAESSQTGLPISGVNVSITYTYSNTTSTLWKLTNSNGIALLYKPVGTTVTYTSSSPCSITGSFYLPKQNNSLEIGLYC